MSRQEEMEVLKMVAEGKLKAEEAMKLLEALRASSGEPQPASEEAPQSPGAARWLRVRVMEDDGETNVNLRIPLFLARWLGNNLGRFIPQEARERMKEHGIDPENLRAALAELSKVGKTQLVDVHDGDDHVEVWLD